MRYTLESFVQLGASGMGVYCEGTTYKEARVRIEERSGH
jgi:hypothetical protein